MLCLQETHSGEDDETVWTNEWGGYIYFSHGSNNLRGVATLIKKDYCCKHSIVHTNMEGRAIIVRLCINDVILCVNNIYAPNRDSPSFFFTEIMQTFENCDNIVVIGDYNTVQDASIDRNRNNSDNVNHVNAMKQIKELAEQLSLEEIWRIRNPNVHWYSWYRTTKKNRKITLQASRLDYALISASLVSKIHNCMYLNGIKSDHSAFFLGIELQNIERG